MYQHILRNLLILSFLNLGTGELNLPRQVNPRRDKDSPVSIAPSANPKFKPIAIDLLDYITKIYPEKELTEKLVNGKKSLYACGVLCDLPGSEDMWGKYGSWYSAKVYFEPNKIDDLPRPGENSSYGYEDVDIEANQLIQDILNCNDVESKNVIGIVPEFTFTNSGFMLLNLNESPSSTNRKMLLAKETKMVEFGGYFREFKSQGTTGQLVALFYAYTINETKEDVPSTMFSNIKEGITGWRKECLYPPIKPFPSMNTSAELFAAGLAIVGGYSQNTASTNKDVENPERPSLEDLTTKDTNSSSGSSSNLPNFSSETDIHQLPKPQTSTSIKGLNQSIFICVEFDNNENLDLAFMRHLTGNHSSQELKFTPQELQSLEKNTPVGPSMNQKLISTTDTLGIAIVRRGSMFIFVLHTTLNPLLSKDWKLPIVAYLNNTIAQQQPLKDINNNNEIEVSPRQLPEATFLEVKPLMENILKKFAVGHLKTTVFGLGVIPNLSNISGQDGPCELSIKLELRSTQLPVVDDRNTQCEYTFMEGNDVINNVLDSHFKDVLNNRETPPSSNTKPIWDIENSKIIFYESNTQSSRTYENMVSSTTDNVSCGVFSLDQDNGMVATASVFVCHKISTECKLHEEICDELLSKLSSFRKSKNRPPLLKWTGSPVAQLLADVLPYIPFDEKNKLRSDPQKRALLLKIDESWFFYLQMTTDELISSSAVVDCAVNHIQNCSIDQDEPTSPEELRKAEQGFHQPSSPVDACLIANSLTLDYGISAVGNCKCIVIETKLPPEIRKWGIGPVFGRMINKLRKIVGAKPFFKEPNRTQEADLFAKRLLLTELKIPDSNSPKRQTGCGLLFPTKPSSTFGPSSNWAFSFTLDFNNTLSTQSTQEEQGDQVDLQTLSHIQNILEKRESVEVNYEKFEWNDSEILMLKEGTQSELDRRQVTSNGLRSVTYGGYIQPGDKNSIILSVLIYQETESITVETASRDKAVEEFINRVKASQLFRTVQLSPATLQAHQFVQAVPYIVRKRTANQEVTVGSSGIVRYGESLFIFIEVLSGNILIEEILEVITKFWNSNKTADKVSLTALLYWEFGHIHWNVASAQLFLVLVSNIISYAYLERNTRAYLVVEVPRNQRLPPDWTTPLDSFQTTLKDMCVCVNGVKEPLVEIVTTSPGTGKQGGINRVINYLQDKPGESSGLIICHSIAMAISHLTIKRENKELDHISNPSRSLQKELINILEACYISNSSTIPTITPFPAGTKTEGFVSISDRISLLDFVLVAITRSPLIVQTYSIKDSKGYWWDTVVLMSAIPCTRSEPAYTVLAYAMLVIYLSINKRPAYIKDETLITQVPTDLPLVNTVAKYNLSDYNCYDGYVLKWRSDREFPKDFNKHLIHLGLFQRVLQQAINDKLLLRINETFTGVIEEQSNKYTCYFVEAGKDGSWKWFLTICSTFSINLLPNIDCSKKSQALKTHLLKLPLENVLPSFVMWEGNVATIINLDADVEQISNEKIVSERVGRLSLKDLPSPRYIGQGDLRLMGDFFPMFGPFSTLDQEHIQKSNLMGVSVLIRRSGGTTVAFLIIVYATILIPQLGNALLYSITQTLPSGHLHTLQEAQVRLRNTPTSTLGLVVTSRFIGSCFHVKGVLAHDQLHGLLTLITAFRTPPPFPAVGGTSNLPRILTDPNDPQALLWERGDAGLHNRIAMTYPANGVYIKVSEAQTIVFALFDPLPSIRTPETTFVSEFLTTLRISPVPQIEISTELCHLAAALGVAMTLKSDPTTAKFVSLQGAFGIVVPLDGKVAITGNEMAEHLLISGNKLISLTDNGMSSAQAAVSYPPAVTFDLKDCKKAVETFLGSSSTIAGAQVVEINGNHFAVALFHHKEPA